MENHLIQIDALIKAGDHGDALKALKGVSLSDFHRRYWVELAALARRLQEYHLAIQILGKVMRGHLEKIDEASPEEMIEYSRSLIKLCFFDEAEKWMASVGSEKYPQVNEIKARIKMTQWDYQPAVYYLKLFRNKQSKDSYPYLISGLNLAASYVGDGQFENSREVLTEVLEVAKTQGLKLVMGNAYELQAQAQILSGDYRSAEASLEESFRIFGKGENIFSFYVRKWKWIRKLLECGPEPGILKEANRLKKEAMDSEFWEDMRDIDRRLAVSSQETALSTKLYFGTVHEAYRKKIIEETPSGFKLPSKYEWAFNLEKNETKNILTPSEIVSDGSVLYNLLNCLTHDFYRPLPLGYIFSYLHPGEYLDPQSSPSRIYMGVTRLRQALPKESGLEIIWNSEGARLLGNGDFALTVQRTRKLVNKSQTHLQKVKSEFKRQWFTAQDVAKVLELTPRSANSVIKKARTTYKVEVSGKGRSIRYRFAG